MSSLHQITLQSVIERANTLVSLPAVALEVVRVTGDEDCSIEELEQAISRDPVLAGRLLKLANSAAFNLGQDVTTLPHASMVLGLRSVKLMALSFALIESLPRAGSEFDFDAYWRRSSVFAAAARSVAESRGSKALGQEAFICGLLAQLGQLVLALSLPEEYARVEARDGWPALTSERAVFSFDSSQVGARMLMDWGVPRRLVTAVAHACHEEAPPEDASTELRELIETLRIAGFITKVLCRVDQGPSIERLYALAEAAMELGRREVDVFLIGLEQDVSDTLASLELNLESYPNHTQLVEEALERLLELSAGQPSGASTRAYSTGDESARTSCPS
jgi:HD-like signal output (HDOD) protein